MESSLRGVIITLGPASWPEERLRSLLNEGVSLIRFPFAKESPEIHVKHHELLRQIADDSGADVQTVADLPGSKPRLTNDEPIDTTPNDIHVITVGASPDTDSQLSLTPALVGEPLDVGSRAVIGDGENTFVVHRCERGVATGHFERKGTIERRRAFVLLQEEDCLHSFTDTDKRCARAAQHAGFDWLAISFVSSGKVLAQIRRWLTEELGWQPQLLAKIETPTGVSNVAEICDEADAVLVGRGDLAVYVGAEGLYDAQRAVIATCRARKTPVAVGTGFVESVAKTGGAATRAEAIDVRCTVEMGADALLLSGETTLGIDPVAAVRELRRIAQQAEEYRA